MAPRFHADCLVAKEIVSNSPYYGLYFIDVAREADIRIGVDWPYPDLKDDECIITKDILEYDSSIKVGDTLTIFHAATDIWNEYAKYYNDYVRSEGEAEQ